MKAEMIKQLEFIYEMQRKQGAKPKYIPVTAVQMREILASNAIMQVIPSMTKPSTLWGIDAHETEVADSVKERMLQIPTFQFVSEYPVSEVVKHNSEIIIREACNCHYITIRTQFLTETTELLFAFEWDIFAKIKRFLRITKWFPIKQKSIIVDCRILYPYCKVSFPHNKHIVQFQKK